MDSVPESSTARWDELCYLPHMLDGFCMALSLLWSSSRSIMSSVRPLLPILISELALLLVVVRGESEIPMDLPRVGAMPDADRTLYIEDAGMFFISGRRFPGMLLRIS